MEATTASPAAVSAETLTANAQAHIKTPGYIGRVLILGMSSQGYPTVLYALMGRSESSRNRKFAVTNLAETKRAVVKTQALDLAKIERADLLVYTAMNHVQLVDGSWACVASNGDQTNDLLDMKSLQDFEDILERRDYENDDHHTPRISGVLRFDEEPEMMMSIILAGEGSMPPASVRRTYADLSLTKGVGHMLSTYVGDGKHLPAFRHDRPIMVPLKGCAKEIARSFWQMLHAEHRVALVVQTFHSDGRTRELHMLDRNTND